MTNPKHQRRFESLPGADPGALKVLTDEHEAIINNRPLFPSTVVNANDSPRLLIDGQNSRKIGRMVTKGAWKGMPIFTLTLPERTTCPKSCHMHRTCYGNAMPFARRHAPGEELEAKLWDEVIDKGEEHPDGFVVRLHVLGDFYSPKYTQMWLELLKNVPALHIFGYTAVATSKERIHHEIAAVITRMNEEFAERCTIRWSDSEPGEMGATVIDYVPSAANVPEGVVCPAEREKTACCATCGLCWDQGFRKKTIVFVGHGMTNAFEAASRVMVTAATASDDEVEELRDRVRELEGVYTNDDWIPTEWKLTASEKKLLMALAKHPTIRKENLYHILYAGDIDGGVDPQIVDVFVCKVRKKVEPVGIKIETIWGEGYKLAPESAAYLDALRQGIPYKPIELKGSALAQLDTRPIVPIPMPARMKPAKLTLDRPEIRMVRLSELRIEASYQRDLSERSISLIRKIVANFSWSKFKPPIVSETPEGLFVIDGQHTCIAAATHPQIESLPCVIVEANTVEQRAEAFVAHNKDRVPMTAQAIFHAQVAAGDPDAVAILEIAKSYGLRVMKYHPPRGYAKRGDLVAVRAMVRLIRGNGRDVADRVLSIIAKSRLGPISQIHVQAVRDVVVEETMADVSGMPDADIAAAINSMPDIETRARIDGAGSRRAYNHAAALLICKAAREAARRGTARQHENISPKVVALCPDKN